MSVLDWRLHPTKGHGVVYWLVMKAIVDGEKARREKQSREPYGDSSFERIVGSQHPLEIDSWFRYGETGPDISDTTWEALIHRVQVGSQHTGTETDVVAPDIP